MDALLRDSRFAHVAKDPKFRRVPKAERKVKIDRRFQGMFKDKTFVVKYSIDKRGRPVKQTTMENLRKYYDLSSSDEESSTEIDDTLEKNNIKNKEKQEEKNINKNLSDEERDACLDKSKESDDSDNNFSSNGELLRIKPKEVNNQEHVDSQESDGEKSSISESLEQATDENDKVLHISSKRERKRLTEEVKKKLRDLSVNYARGEGVLLTDSSSEEETSEYDDQEEEVDHCWGELDKEAETTDQITRRLAVCNMDWDRIRAVDLMVLFNSFLRSGGVIHSVTIYPSEFGQQRMKEEEIKGPAEIVETTADEDRGDNTNDNDEDGAMYHMEKLRQYQLNRLKYYYAVVDCDCPDTANTIYTECDGMEYESTATKLDLRFIPDDMEFDQEPREVCDKLPELSKYCPRQFTTTALQQVKVKLTWDETNQERQEINQKLNSVKLEEINENDVRTYLASCSSDDDSGTETQIPEGDDVPVDSKDNTDKIEKYKSLLKNIQEQEEAKNKKDVELEFTWDLGVKEKTEKLMKERMKDENLTPFEQYLEKRKAKKKAKKEEKKQLKTADGAKSSENEDMSSDTDESVDSRSDDIKSLSGKKTKMSEKKRNKNSVCNDNNQQAAELELLLMDKSDDGNKRHFNMKDIEERSTMSKSKQKRLNKRKDTSGEVKEDDFVVNVEDPRFNALFTSHHFNIDPADSHYRKTKGTEALINEKLKRRASGVLATEDESKRPKTDRKFNPELQALVNSVKRKSQNISQRIK